MLNPTVTKTQTITRDELRTFLPSPRAVKAIENLVADVSKTLPTSLDAITDTVNTLSTDVDTLQGQVVVLQDRVTALEARVLTLEQEVSDALGQANALTGITSNLREQIRRIASSINDIEQKPL